MQHLYMFALNLEMTETETGQAPTADRPPLLCPKTSHTFVPLQVSSSHPGPLADAANALSGRRLPSASSPRRSVSSSLTRSCPRRRASAALTGTSLFSRLDKLPQTVSGVSRAHLKKFLTFSSHCFIFSKPSNVTSASFAPLPD